MYVDIIFSNAYALLNICILVELAVFKSDKINNDVNYI